MPNKAGETSPLATWVTATCIGASGPLFKATQIKASSSTMPKAANQICRGRIMGIFIVFPECELDKKFLGICLVKRLIDFSQSILAQQTHRRLQAQLAQQVTVFSLIQIATCRVELLLRVQPIEVGAYPDFLAQFAGFQGALTGSQRLLQRPDLGDAADNAKIGLTGLQRDAAARVFQFLFGALMIGFPFAPPGFGRP